MHHSHHYHQHEHKCNHHNHPHKLDVILVCSNTWRFESRYRLFKKIEKELRHNKHVRLTVVEMAFGRRGHHVSNHIQLRSSHDIWQKEAMINVGISRLPHDWKYVCWYDGDVSFQDENWALETIEALQHYQVVQPWCSAVDLGPNGEVIQTHKSFCSVYLDGGPLNGGNYYQYAHPGYVWAARREAITNVGGLISHGILGAGDRHMAYALIGKGNFSVPNGVTEAYRKQVLRWEELAERYIKRDIGFVPNTILHHWHGKKKDRRYHDRWKILVEYQFDPCTDLVRDWHGLWQLRVETPRQIALRDACRGYMASRNEDSIDME